MENKIAVIAHADFGRTTLDAAELKIIKDDKKTIHELIEEDTSIKITAPPEIPLIEWNFKSGKENRRERRARERKLNKNVWELSARPKIGWAL